MAYRPLARVAWLALGCATAAACNRPAAPAPAPQATAHAAAPASAQPGAAPQAAPAEAAAAPAGTPAPPQVPGFDRPTGPVASVNGRDIPAERFNAEFDKLVGHGARIPADRLQRIARNILSRLVDAELREQAIKNENIELTEPEFQAAYKEFTDRFVDADGRFDDSRFQAELKRMRLTETQLRNQIREQRLARKLVEKLGRVEISEAELRAFYDNNPSAWVEPASRDVRPILVRVPQEASPEAKKQAEASAQKAYQALKKGGDFEQIARQFGDAPLPPIHLVRNSNEPELEEAAFKLKVGEVSPPVRTRWGFYVLRLIEKNEQRTRPYGEVRDEIRSTMLARRQYIEDRRIVQELRGKAQIVEKLPF